MEDGWDIHPLDNRGSNGNEKYLVTSQIRGVSEQWYALPCDWEPDAI